MVVDELAAKPVPDTVTVVPVTPVDGDMDIEGVTVYVAEGTPAHPFAVTV